MSKSFFYSLIAIFISLNLNSCSNKIEVNSENIKSPISNINPIIKVYIENSGSMDGYMCAGSQLKDAVYDYISDLNQFSDTTQLYYLNSQIVPFHNNLNIFIKELNPSSFRLAGGNREHSDIGAMLETILRNMNDSTVSIFISDCILDLPSVDSQKFLNNCQIAIKNAIINGKKHIPDLGVEILKMSSNFEGKYFYQNGTIDILKDVNRPYYIWIFGNKGILSKLNSDVPFTDIEKYGLEDMVAFTTQTSVPFEIKNRNLTNNIINVRNGDFPITIRANFRGTLQPENAIQNVDNYKFNNSSLIIEHIRPITAKCEYTHYINIVIPNGTKIVEEDLQFNIPKMPEWVKNSNDDNGTDIKNNINKTTGIKYLIQGVADAYKRDIISTNFKFLIKRK